MLDTTTSLQPHYHHITLFLPDGKTLRFYEVTNFYTSYYGGKRQIFFNYTSQSDQKKKFAEFERDGLLGIAWAFDDAGDDSKVDPQ